MSADPLAPPSDHRVLQLYLRHFGIARRAGPQELLGQVLRTFSRLPYENLTKIIRQAERGGPDDAKRLPADVVADHVRTGAGGTCFSLTAALAHLLRAAGWQVQPILADRRYGANTHCALLVWIDDQPHLVDPGYLIVDPIPLGVTVTQRVTTAFNELLLKPQPGGGKLDLFTMEREGPRYRLTFRTAPADRSEFVEAWDRSFSWDMMRYPLLTRVSGGRQLYLRGNRLQMRDGGSIARSEIPPAEMAQRIAAEFGIDATLAAKALAILQARGERLSR